MLERLIIDSVETALRSGQRAARTGAEILERANLGVGPVRLTPAAAERLRRFWAARIREALEVPHADDLPSPTEPGHGEPDPEAALSSLLSTEPPQRPSPPERLRDRFLQLLERSVDPEVDDELHPAFLAIVDQLSPDEARILRLLDDEGPHPVVDVVATPRLGRGDTLIAENLSLIGDRAGCRDTGAAPAYLANLERLGIIAIRDEELVGNDDYELIEVGPRASDLAEHIEEDRNQRPRFVHRAARLTPLGDAFCRVCIPDSAGL